MCTYSQLKKIKKICATPPGSQWRPLSLLLLLLLLLLNKTYRALYSQINVL